MTKIPLWHYSDHCIIGFVNNFLLYLTYFYLEYQLNKDISTFQHYIWIYENVFHV